MADLPDLPELTAAEQRLLGSLLEKEVTVPGSYPMSLNGLRSACNQASSREPVSDYDDQQVMTTVRGLQERELVGVTWADSGRRVLKYVQRLSHVLELAGDERALLTVLLLRGAQPPGALKSRTERLHAFGDRNDVEACLQRMARREPPLVQELPRQAREQDQRWIHLLGPVEHAVLAPGGAQPGSMAAPVDTGESVLADGPHARDERVRAAYGTIADAYADALADELDELEFDSWLLDRVAETVGDGPAVEVGTGPGHVAAYLATRGVTATGIDLTPEMIEQARARFPGVHYEVGDLRSLMRPPTAPGWDAVLAWYSLIHLAGSELPGALDALIRPLQPDGRLVLAMHAGRGVRSSSSWFDRPVDLQVVLHDPATVVDLVERAGLVDVEWYLRGPVTARGETTQRFYLLARRPSHG